MRPWFPKRPAAAVRNWGNDRTPCCSSRGRAISPTIAEQMALCGDRPAGFDYLRILLALLVVASHVSTLSYGLSAARADWAGPLRPLLAAIVPMFFALSGFLVAGSMVRCRSLFGFLGLRVIRLAPALMVDTALSALILGPLLTTLPLRAYVTDPLFIRYWTNLVGEVQFLLPGLFADHPTHYVNEQLWTLPWELACYGSLAALWLCGAIRYRQLTLSAAIGIGVFNVFHSIRFGLPPDPYQSPGFIISCFLVGVAMYQYRHEVRLRSSMLLLCSALSTWLLTDAYMQLLAFVPLTYVTVHLGMTNPARIRLFASGDYSYGIYLYAFPLQQAAVALFGPLPAWRALLLAVPMICALAAFSWWCVERPAMKILRPRLERSEACWLKIRAHLITTIRNRRETTS